MRSCCRRRRAAGRYPVKAVQAMAEVIEGAEKYQLTHTRTRHRVEGQFKGTEEAIAMAVMYTANHMKVRAIVALTETGATPLWMSRIRSDIPIYAFTRHEATRRRVTLYRGVYPVIFDVTKTELHRRALYRELFTRLLELQLVKKNDLVILTKGELSGVQGGTNSMLILKVALELRLRLPALDETQIRRGGGIAVLILVPLAVVHVRAARLAAEARWRAARTGRRRAGDDRAGSRSACPRSRRLIASTWPTAPVSFTGRTGFSRWTCRGGWPRASCPNCLARWRSSRTRRRACFGSGKSHAPRSSGHSGAARGPGSLCAWRERGVGEPAQPAVGILGARVGTGRSGDPRTRCSSRMPCGGICSTRESTARLLRMRDQCAHWRAGVRGRLEVRDAVLLSGEDGDAGCAQRAAPAIVNTGAADGGMGLRAAFRRRRCCNDRAASRAARRPRLVSGAFVSPREHRDWQQQLGGQRPPDHDRRCARCQRHASARAGSDRLVSRRLRVKATAIQPALDLNGVTLPGAPLLVAGSNGHIAWGFTNSYGDWLDVAKARSVYCRWRVRAATAG